jgi:hypothetical protein
MMLKKKAASECEAAADFSTAAYCCEVVSVGAAMPLVS